MTGGSEAPTVGVRPRSAGRSTAVLLTLLGAGLIILAGTRTWATVKVGGNLPGMSDLTVSGRRAAPAGIPVALAAAAAAIVLITSGRVVRAVVAVGLGVAGAVLAVTAVRATRDTSGAVAKALRDSLGLYSSSDAGSGAADGWFAGGNSVAISAWPWVAGLGAVLIVGASLLVLIKGWSWPGPTRRYERAGKAVPAPASLGAAARSGPRPAGPAEVGPAGTWDALSRGEDPTSKVEDPT